MHNMLLISYSLNLRSIQKALPDAPKHPEIIINCKMDNHPSVFLGVNGTKHSFIPWKHERTKYPEFRFMLQIERDCRIQLQNYFFKLFFCDFIKQRKSGLHPICRRLSFYVPFHVFIR